ncbi:2-hydroxyacid dehydrogenase [Siccirubricoccus sp. KC 17139]|uniref:2-hydroxyacid dehydrogenase n=1 Tax=Siccirubricoccus soli TaxID=2899147 RepID=A0ABT1D9C8_9PROT|nr:2-hydroxyacid dehydrogenase [Siccirubricoccus soli]MCO6417865.1 2-hydroxyacid dehydrogenase [Siccirubricoccus soli]MCP2684000.1 2-hydroxyacid dehydrogenase [Siccirubricoccus soli]
MDKPELLVMGELPDWDLAPMAERYTLHLLYAAPEPEALLAACAPRIRGIVTKGEIGASAALMQRLPRLEIVACYGVGVDAIDRAWCAAHGVPVTNTPDVLTEDVADMAFALLLGVARRIPQADAWVREGRWVGEGSMPLTTRVWGRRLGIVGLGRIGRAVARRAEGFDMRIAYSGRSPKPDLSYAYHPSPAALAPHCEVMVCCAMGGPATEGLIDRAAIDALPPGAIFVNVSRGSCVDEAALLAALREGWIALAALDVFRNEPAIDPEFARLPNVLLAPHAASGTVATRQAMGALMQENLAAHFAGQPLPTEIRP